MVPFKPNLINYDKARHSFSYQDAKNDIDFVKGKLNAAYNAVERHAKSWRKNKIALGFG